MPKNYKKIGLLFAVFVPLILSLSACVPVVVVAVGAAAGKGVIDESANSVKPKKSELILKEPVGIPDPDNKPKDSNAVVPSSEIETAQIQPKVNTPEEVQAPEKVQALSAVSEQLPSEVQTETTKQALVIPDNKPAEPQRAIVSPRVDQKSSHEYSVATTVNHLINKGWKVSLSEPQQSNILEAILYFDANNNYYGFDGCKHFKGKFVASSGNQLLIKSLIVSSKGSDQCGNEIERNLFFVNVFNLHDNDILLSNKDKLVMTLSQIDHFNAGDFLTKAKVKYRKEKSIVKKSSADKSTVKKASSKNISKKAL